MERRIVLDKNSFMALASENRVTVLKKLDERKMTVSELAKQMDISKPALLKHLKRLVEADLVKKIDDERKWVYYTLTNRGKNVLHPDRVKITLLLSSSLISLLAALAMLWQYISSKSENIIFYNKAGTEVAWMDSSSVNNSYYMSEGRLYDYFSTSVTYNESYIQLGVVLAIIAAILCLLCLNIMLNKSKKTKNFI